MRLLLAVLTVSLTIPAAEFCEPSAEVRQALNRFTTDTTSEKAVASTLQIADELISEFPTDYFVLDRVERIGHYEKPEIREKVQAKLAQLVKEHPDSPGVALVYAKSLVDYDTPRAIQLLKVSTAPWSHIALADVYSFGKFSDRAEARRQVELYFKVCPDSMEGRALAMLQRQATPEIASRYASRLRDQLMHETDKDRLRAWETVWNLEFKARPATEHEALRKTVAQDVARLEGMKIPEIEQWLDLLAKGYSLANDSTNQSRLEKKLSAQFPKSWQAKSLLRQKFQKEHPWPKPSDLDEVKQAFHQAQLAFADDQLKKQPDEFEYLMMRFESLAEIKSTKLDEIAAAGNAELAALRRGTSWSGTPPFE